MNEPEYLAKIVKETLEAGRPLVLVSVMHVQGSAPRHGVVKMAVAEDGKSHGTIGGSLIEAAAIRESRGVFSRARTKTLSYDLSGQGTGSPDMICGGRAELLLDYLPATAENREFSRRWHDAISRGQGCYVLTHLKGAGGDIEVIGHAVLDPDGRVSGTGSLTESDIDTLRPELHNISTTDVLPLKDTRVMVDRIRKVKTIYCFGAGHVAVPTAHLAATAGFRVVVTDDRPDFASAERFPEASGVRVIPDFDRALEGLEIDSDACIIIVTRGHQYDRTVLEQSLRTPAGYIGMISSRRKREAIYAALRAEGVPKEQLERVHSPIGLDIGAETPEEIAVSIVAELISVRSRPPA